MVVALQADTRALDPLGASDNVTANDQQVFENLIFIGPDGEPQTMLAKSWEQSSPAIYAYHIRKGIKFLFDRDMESVDIIDRHTI